MEFCSVKLIPILIDYFFEFYFLWLCNSHAEILSLSLFRHKSDALTIESANESLYRKKLYFRSIHRGTKEMDKLLGAFAAKYLLKFSFKQLLIYEQFIELNDDVLYKSFLGQEKFPFMFTEGIGEFLQEFQQSLKLP